MRKSCYCAVSREVLRLLCSGFEPKKIGCSFCFLCAQLLDDIPNLSRDGQLGGGGSVSQERWEQASAMVTCILGSLPDSTSQGQLDAPRSIWKQSAQGILFKDNFWRSVLDTRKLMGNFLFKIMNEWILKNSAIFWPYWSDFIQVPSWERDSHTGYSFQQWQYLAFNTFLEYFLGGCLPARR